MGYTCVKFQAAFQIYHCSPQHTKSTDHVNYIATLAAFIKSCTPVETSTTFLQHICGRRRHSPKCVCMYVQALLACKRSKADGHATIADPHIYYSLTALSTQTYNCNKVCASSSNRPTRDSELPDSRNFTKQ